MDNMEFEGSEITNKDLPFFRMDDQLCKIELLSFELLAFETFKNRTMLHAITKDDYEKQSIILKLRMIFFFFGQLNDYKKNLNIPND